MSLSLWVPRIAPFLAQIKANNASLLRQISIKAPRAWHWEDESDPNQVSLPRGSADFLKSIQTACPGLRTVELLSEPELDPEDESIPIRNVDLAAKMVRLLYEGGLRDMRSLEKIVVIHGTYEKLDDETMVSRESLMAMIPSDKWAIKLIEVPPDWCLYYDYDHGDCLSYNIESIGEEQESSHSWEYYLGEGARSPRRVPHHKNDSDVG